MDQMLGTNILASTTRNVDMQVEGSMSFNQILVPISAIFRQSSSSYTIIGCRRPPYFFFIWSRWWLRLFVIDFRIQLNSGIRDFCTSRSNVITTQNVVIFFGAWIGPFFGVIKDLLWNLYRYLRRWMTSQESSICISGKKDNNQVYGQDVLIEGSVKTIELA